MQWYGTIDFRLKIPSILIVQDHRFPIGDATMFNGTGPILSASGYHLINMTGSLFSVRGYHKC